MRLITVFAIFLAISAHAQKLDIMTSGYPRAGFFRISEYTAANDRVPLEKWLDAHGKLLGVYGKVCDEEYVYATKENKEGLTKLDFFNEYKKRFQGKMALLHFNGSSRIPTFKIEPFFAGHWLYYEGTEVLSDIEPRGKYTEIKVRDVSRFMLNDGRYKSNGSDVCIARMSDGKPDWTYAEQATVVEINVENSTIVVERAKYGTAHKAFTKEETYIAPHFTEGPFGKAKNADLLWKYNFSSNCPVDENGKTCGDILAVQIGGFFSEKGPLADFDGIEFDAIRSIWYPDLYYKKKNIKLDYNGDGIGDDGFFAGINVYQQGYNDFCKRLKTLLPEDKYVFADLGQSAFGILSGVESEGFSANAVYDFINWSDRYNKMDYWANRTENSDFSFIGGRVDLGKDEEFPFDVIRMQLAASCFLGIGYFVNMKAPADTSVTASVFDELCKGNAQELGWLGMPEDKTTYFLTNDKNNTLDWKVRLVEEPGRYGHKYILKDVPYQGNMFITMNASVHNETEPNANIPEIVKVNIGTKAKTWQKEPALIVQEAYMDSSPSDVSFYFSVNNYDRSKPDIVDVEIEVRNGVSLDINDISCFSSPVGMFRQFENGLVIANLSDEEMVFNLKEMFPESVYSRLEAQYFGDDKVNDGSQAELVSLPRKDALFLKKD